MTDETEKPVDETAVDLRKATLQEIAAFSARVLEGANPRTMIRKAWIAVRIKKAEAFGLRWNASKGLRSDVAVDLARELKATPEDCTGCAVGTILLHDGPEALRDWVAGGIDGWKEAGPARRLFHAMSDAFEGAHTRAEGLERCIAIARHAAETGEIESWHRIPSTFWRKP